MCTLYDFLSSEVKFIHASTVTTCRSNFCYEYVSRTSCYYNLFQNICPNYVTTPWHLQNPPIEVLAQTSWSPLKFSKYYDLLHSQNVRDAYAMRTRIFFPDQECDSVSVHV